MHFTSTPMLLQSVWQLYLITCSSSSGAGGKSVSIGFLRERSSAVTLILTTQTNQDTKNSQTYRSISDTKLTDTPLKTKVQ